MSIYPQYAIVDTNFIEKQPDLLFIDTAMDALSHLYRRFFFYKSQSYC